MKQIGQRARISLAHKHLGTTGAVGVALRILSRELVSETLREGYIQHGVLFVRVSDHAVRMRLFQQKVRLVTLVNEDRQRLGFSHRVTAIRSIG